MDELNKCLNCSKYFKDLLVLDCAHKVLCTDCFGSQEFYQCEDCQQAVPAKKFLLASDSYEDRKCLRCLPNALEDEGFEKIFRNIEKIEEKKRFWQIFQNFFGDPKCCLCDNAEISFLCLREIKGYCRECRSSSAVFIESAVVKEKKGVLMKFLVSSLTVYGNCLLIQTLKNVKEHYLVLVYCYLFKQFGQGVNGVIYECPWCCEEFDYIHRVPLVYSCEYNEKHIYCTQCHYKCEEHCKFDKKLIRNVRIYYEVIDKIRCMNACRYFGVEFIEIGPDQLLCKDCGKRVESEKSVSLRVKQSLVFFNVLCSQHKQTANFFSSAKFQAFCYDCSDETASEASALQIAGVVEQKVKWIYEEMAGQWNGYQLSVLNKMNLRKFLSISEKYQGIRDFLQKMKEFYFFKPQPKLNAMPKYLFINGPASSFKYSEYFELNSDPGCYLEGILLNCVREMKSFSLKSKSEGHNEFTFTKTIENFNISQVKFETPLEIKTKTSYEFEVCYEFHENFKIPSFHKYPSPQHLEQNSCKLTYFFSAQHNCNLFTQGVILAP